MSSGSGPYGALTDDEKRSLLVLLMEDIRGSFDLGAGERSHAVLYLARELCYDHVEALAREYIEDDGYRDGRHFRLPWSMGGYESPPFPVVRTRAEASEALQRAVDSLCDFPEYRLPDADADARPGGA